MRNARTLLLAALPAWLVACEQPTAPRPPVSEGCTSELALNLDQGGFERFTGSPGEPFPCLRFDPSHAGRQYLVLLENMPLFGSDDVALFAATGATPASDTAFAFTLRGRPDPAAGISTAAVQQRLVAAVPAAGEHAWDFGAGRVYEHVPSAADARAAAPRTRSGRGDLVEINSAAATPAVGDTVFNLRTEGIARLGINMSVSAKAVIRHVSRDLIIAEDTRLESTLLREDGSRNTPLSPALLDSIAAQYALHARPQGDLLFAGRHNAAVEAASEGRVLAVHSLTYGDSIWGYTYAATSYFVFDYWVRTNGSTRGDNQHPQRVVDNLFMHEIAHMRHWGVLERGGELRRGNRWLFEGFARFSERLPIAARLLGAADPPRTGNVQLPLNPVFSPRFFRDDVPTYLNAGTPLGNGYQHSSWVFDYFADQVAVRGADWRTAVRELLIAGGRSDAADAAVARWLPGMSLRELITRARVALYTDDIGAADLPTWTQYHQYQLRLSRPPASQEAADPRNAWQKLTPGTPLQLTGGVPAGGATGFLIDGTRGSAPTIYSIEAPATTNTVVSVTRIR